MEGGREQVPVKGATRVEGLAQRGEKGERFSSGQFLNHFKRGLKSGVLYGTDIREL